MSTLTSIREIFANMVFPEGLERRNQFERLSNTDELTGLANRRLLESLCQSRAFDSKVYILFDLNNFGMVNKAYSQDYGDNILCNIAEILLNNVSKAKGRAKAFRIGGDEFLVAIDKHLAEKFRNSVELEFGKTHFNTDKYDFILSVSGVIGESYKAAGETLQNRKIAAKS